MSVLGIDVGASAVKSAVFPEKAEPACRAEEKTADSYGGLKAQIQGIVARTRDARRILAVGIGVPGFIASRERTIEISPNMRFLDGAALEKDLAAGIGLPVVVENDANAAALGEYLALEEPRPDVFVHLTLGSGIGSGVILDGRIFRGSGGFAAELGHLLVNSQGRPCGCGNRGCAETESSEAGIVASYREYSGSQVPLSSRDVFVRLQQGDEAARQAFQRAGRYLGTLLGQIVYSFNPGRIAIGGGVAAAGEALLRPAREELARRVIAKAVERTAIAPALLGNDAGAAGAAALARQLRP